MGVDHSIYVGYGFKLTEEQVDEFWRRQHPEDPDLDNYDGAEEAMYGGLEPWPDLTHFAAGSYYDDAPMEFAVVLRITYERAEDLAGFLEVAKPLVTASMDDQLWSAWREFAMKDTKPPLRWLVGGLWH